MCLNRFCIDEDAAFELSGVLGKTVIDLRLDKRIGVNYNLGPTCTSLKLSLKQLEIKEPAFEFDHEVIDFALRKVIESDKENQGIHLIFACEYLVQL